MESFVHALYELSEHRQYHNRDELIMDRIVIGIQDRTVYEKLQLMPDLTLTIAMHIARQSELIKFQMEDVNSDLTVDLLSLLPPHHKQQKTHGKKQQFHPATCTSNCQRCGLIG